MAYSSSYNGQQVDRGIDLATSSYTPTLLSAPTSSTLTFTLGQDTIDFRIGMFCRVADANEVTGYKFYQLNDIVVANEGEPNETTSAVWKQVNIGVMGASGNTHASGLVPDTPTTAGTTKFLREDGTWQTVANLTNSAVTSGSLELTPNTFYSLGALTGALTVTLGTAIDGIPNTYMMEFDINDSASTPTKVPSFPASVVWKEEPTWTSGKHYEVSIRYSANTQAYYGIIAEFDTAS